MAAKTTPYTIDDHLDETIPLTEEERAAVERARADIAAGRVHTHEHVTKWLRQRAREIVERAHKRSTSS